MFSLANGCRRGEGCGLKWSAVDLIRRVAIIRESRYQVRGKNGTKIDEGRSHSGSPAEANCNAGARLFEKSAQSNVRRIAFEAWIGLAGHSIVRVT